MKLEGYYTIADCCRAYGYKRARAGHLFKARFLDKGVKVARLGRNILLTREQFLAMKPGKPGNPRTRT